MIQSLKRLTLRPYFFGAVLLAVFFAPALRAEGVNPWGIMAPKSTGVPQAFIESVKETGAIYLRPGDVWVEEWIKASGKCDECFKLRNSGLGLILTLRNNGRSALGKPGNPTTPPKDLGAYQKAVGQILENYRPALLVLENEENGGAFYSGGSDAAKEYSKQLSVGCEEAHQRNMRCSNGGLTNDTAVLLTWFQYMTTGQQEKACSFAKRAFREKNDPDAAEKLCKIKFPAKAPDKYKKQIEAGRKFIQVYRSAPIDFINLHWTANDAEAFKETVDFLRQATGKAVISNEIAPRALNDNPKIADSFIQAVKDKNLAFAIWHHTERPNNKALKQLLKENYP